MAQTPTEIAVSTLKNPQDHTPEELKSAEKFLRSIWTGPLVDKVKDIGKKTAA
jgi:hypothetical protein